MQGNEQQAVAQYAQQQKGGTYHVIKIDNGSVRPIHKGELSPSIVNGFVRTMERTIAQMPVFKKIFDFRDSGMPLFRPDLITIKSLIDLGISQVDNKSSNTTNKYKQIAIITSTVTKMVNGVEQGKSNIFTLQYNPYGATNISSQVFNNAQNIQDEGVLVNRDRTIAYGINGSVYSCNSVVSSAASSSLYKEVNFLSPTDDDPNYFGNQKQNFLCNQYLNVVQSEFLAIAAKDLVVRWNGQVVLYTANDTDKTTYWRTIDDIITHNPNIKPWDFIQRSDDGGNTDYWALLPFKDVVPTKYGVASVTASALIRGNTTTSGTGYCVHYTKGAFFFTSFDFYAAMGADKFENNQAPYPATINNSSIVWAVIPTYNENNSAGTKLKQGYPVVQRTSLEVIELQSYAGYLTVIHQGGVCKMRLKADSQGLPYLDIVPSGEAQAEPSESPTSRLINNQILFCNRDQQFKSLTPTSRAELMNVSYGAIPNDSTIDPYQYIDSTSKTITGRCAPTVDIKPVSILGEKFACIGRYTLANIQGLGQGQDKDNAVHYSFLRGNTVQVAGETPSTQQVYLPYGIDAATDDGAFFAIGPTIYQTVQQYSDSDGVSEDFFNPMLLRLEDQYFVGSSVIQTIKKIHLTFKATNLIAFNEFPIGIIIIENAATYQDYRANCYNDAWWSGSSNLGKNYMNFYPINKTASDTIFTIDAPVNKAMKGFKIILRIGSFNNGVVNYPIDKVEFLNIIYEIK